MHTATRGSNHRRRTWNLCLLLEHQRRVIASVTHLEGQPEGEQSTVSPAWAKGESPSAADRGDASEAPPRVTLRGEAQQGMLQVTPGLAQRPRARGGSGDTWRYRSKQGLKDPGRPERDQWSPDLRGAPRVGRCWSGEGLELGRGGHLPHVSLMQ